MLTSGATILTSMLLLRSSGRPDTWSLPLATTLTRRSKPQDSVSKILEYSGIPLDFEDSDSAPDHRPSGAVGATARGAKALGTKALVAKALGAN
mmetsp:Transcript_9245/g.14592  ORF Transcript_9245/g.14592 Transcript_9245/m.14592 type:complete len:94 (-) Transcript_9245:197-478(-)